jgi:hypothetical protein
MSSKTIAPPLPMHSLASMGTRLRENMGSEGVLKRVDWVHLLMQISKVVRAIVIEFYEMRYPAYAPLAPLQHHSLSPGEISTALFS